MSKRLRHGFARGRRPQSEYYSWAGMKQRCYNQSHSSFVNYGGRGISVCDRWRNSFENFIADMGIKPSPQHSLDRIDNNGNYEPGNCRWATGIEQENNTRVTVFIEALGQTKSLLAWSRELGISPETIRWRVNNGYSPEDCLKAGSFSRRIKHERKESA